MIKVKTEELPRGVIESHDFPSSAKVGLWDSWNGLVHNVGAEGRFALGVVNTSGNPGNLTLKRAGESETVVIPGYYLRYQTPEGGIAPNCTRYKIIGEVKFSVIGEYFIKLWGMHFDGVSWLIDDEKWIYVTVTEEIVPPPEPKWWEGVIKYIEENPAVLIVGVGAVIGGWAVSRRPRG